MPATIDRTIPKSFPKRAMPKSPREGFTFTVENESIRNNEILRQAWFNNAVVFTPHDPALSTDERKQRAKEWVAGLDELAKSIERKRVGSKTLYEDLMESRNRLELGSPSLYSAGKGKS